MLMKVISDDGFVVQVIRPVKDYPLVVGQTISVEKTKHPVSLEKMFDNLLEGEMMEEIMKRVRNEVSRSPKTGK